MRELGGEGEMKKEVIERGGEEPMEETLTWQVVRKMGGAIEHRRPTEERNGEGYRQPQGWVLKQ